MNEFRSDDATYRPPCLQIINCFNYTGKNGRESGMEFYHYLNFCAEKNAPKKRSLLTSRESTYPFKGRCKFR